MNVSIKTNKFYLDLENIHYLITYIKDNIKSFDGSIDGLDDFNPSKNLSLQSNISIN